MKKVLVIGPDYIGDYLFRTPAIRTIKMNMPDCSITYFVKKRYSFPLVKNNPDIDSIITYEQHHLLLIFKKFFLLLLIKRKKFDIAFVFSRGLTRGLIPYVTGIKERVGYYTPKRKKHKWMFTFGMPEPDADRMHKVEYNLKLINGYFKSNYNPGNYVISIREDAEQFAERLFKDFKNFYPLICFNCGPNLFKAQHVWPPDYFGKLGYLIYQQFPNGIIILVGSKDERVVAERIAALLTKAHIILAGETTLLQLCAILKKCNLVISADSGIMHLACAVKTSVIALFGGSSPAKFGPYGKGRHITIEKKDIREITPDMVMAKVLEILRK